MLFAFWLSRNAIEGQTRLPSLREGRRQSQANDRFLHSPWPFFRMFNNSHGDLSLPFAHAPAHMTRLLMTFAFSTVSFSFADSSASRGLICESCLSILHDSARMTSSRKGSFCKSTPRPYRLTQSPSCTYPFTTCQTHHGSRSQGSFRPISRTPTVALNHCRHRRGTFQTVLGRSRLFRVIS